MKLGVRFCGGCNPRYDRGKAFEDIKKMIYERKGGEIEITVANEEEEYDSLLLICGCTNCCASFEQFKNRGEVFYLWSEGDVENMVERLVK